MRCDHCQQKFTEEEHYNHGSQALCENCYLEAVGKPRVCDPWAAYNAQSLRENMGLKGEAGLTELQKAMYDFVKGRGHVSMDEILETFALSPRELETSFAVLRHCALVRAYKEDDVIYVTTF